jgi:hypothetical protein
MPVKSAFSFASIRGALEVLPRCSSILARRVQRSRSAAGNERVYSRAASAAMSHSLALASRSRSKASAFWGSRGGRAMWWTTSESIEWSEFPSELTSIAAGAGAAMAKYLASRDQVSSSVEV